MESRKIVDKIKKRHTPRKTTTLEQGIQNYIGYGFLAPDYESAFKLFKQAFNETPSVETAFWLSKCYEYGHGVQKDCKKANSFYKFIIEQSKGDNASDYTAISYYRLSINTRYGRGTEKDEHKANIQLERAAKLGLCDAQYEIGVRKLTGYGVEQNYTKAIRYLTAAANPMGEKITASSLAIRGDARAQALLGWCYATGVAVKDVDTNKAMAYYQSAALQDNMQAKYALKENTMDSDTDWSEHALQTKLNEFQESCDSTNKPSFY